MPRTGITAYDLLISCPGDVNKYVDVVKKCIDEFNRLLGRINNAEIVGKHWSTESYSQSGKRPQELLNEQFVKGCDAAVAIFWTKFGTPTEKYGSGTEEEIEEMLSAGKQVFMYFIDEPINPSEINHEQYKKVQEFRDRYKDKGIYFVIRSVEELEKQFMNDLTRYFFPLIIGSKDSSDKKIEKPLLRIIDYESKTNTISSIASHFCNSKFIEDQENSIIELINELSDKTLPKREKSEDKETENVLKNNLFANISFSETTDAEIEESDRELIIKFADKMGIRLSDDFWNVGDLKRSKMLIKPIFGGNSISYVGSEEEKSRYNKMMDLCEKIEELNEYIEYFQVIDKYRRVKLILNNYGTNYDEDIDIKLHIEKGKLVKKKDIPIPGMLIIDTILDMKFIEGIFKEKGTESISNYSDYPIEQEYFSYNIQDPFNQRTSQQEYEDSKDKYINNLDSLFCYEVFEKENEDVISIHVSYLKHHTSVAFPTELAFTDLPDIIQYEISSKNNAELVNGTLNLSF